MIRFVLAPHSQRVGAGIVEIWDGDVFLGALYPGDAGNVDARSVRLISRHFSLVFTPRLDGSANEPQAIQAQFTEVTREQSREQLQKMGLVG